MLVVAARDFMDVKAGVNRQAGSAFEVDEARYAEINSTSNGRLAWRVAPDEQPAPKPKKTTRKQAE